MTETIIARFEETVPAPDIYYYYGNDHILPLLDVECLDVYCGEYNEMDIYNDVPVLILPEGKQADTYDNCKIHITVEIIREDYDNE